MNHIYRYNHLFFTEESKDDRDTRNMNFWSALDIFDKKHPEANLTIFHDVKKDPFVDRYVEILEFQCNLESETKQVQAIYNQHYYLSPLFLLPYLQRVPSDAEIHDLGNKS